MRPRPAASRPFGRQRDARGRFGHEAREVIPEDERMSAEQILAFLAGIATVAPTKQAIALQTQLRKDLAAVVSPGSGLPHKAAQRVKREAEEQLVGIPTYEIRTEDRTTVNVRWEYAPLRFTGVIAHGVLLLLDEKKGLGTRVKRCTVKACNRFFLAPTTGGRPRETCEAHVGTGAERTRRWRERKAAAAKHK